MAHLSEWAMGVSTLCTTGVYATPQQSIIRPRVAGGPKSRDSSTGQTEGTPWEAGPQLQNSESRKKLLRDASPSPIAQPKSFLPLPRVAGPDGTVGIANFPMWMGR